MMKGRGYLYKFFDWICQSESPTLPTLTPEQMLYWELLRDAIDIARGEASGALGEKKYNPQKLAWAWIDCDEPEAYDAANGYISFACCCQVLGINPSWLRRMMAQFRGSESYQHGKIEQVLELARTTNLNNREIADKLKTLSVETVRTYIYYNLTKDELKDRRLRIGRQGGKAYLPEEIAEKEKQIIELFKRGKTGVEIRLILGISSKLVSRAHKKFLAAA